MLQRDGVWFGLPEALTGGFDRVGSCPADQNVGRSDSRPSARHLGGTARAVLFGAPELTVEYTSHCVYYENFGNLATGSKPGQHVGATSWGQGLVVS